MIVALGIFGLLATAAAPVAAVEPIDAREPATLQRAAPPPVAPAPAPPVVSPVPSVAPAVDLPGIDVSWPQCGAELPAEFGFAIVGVNRGLVYAPNPCLASGEPSSQLEWAGADADLYVNTANPGPDISGFWPHGQRSSRDCNTANRPGADTADCAYLYGWNAAADSYRIALEAFVALGWAEADADRVPGERTWWLDVETANSWRGDTSLNVAALQGAVDYLESMDAEVGFYSTPLLWWRVTGGTDRFAEYPAWHAGASSVDDARARCVTDEAFTGGELAMMQWVENGLDRNVICPSGD
ncbi:MAG TPA: hypothetical protein VJ975_05785 [Candidatus Limnocylindria bacterium]|nr:hypothetical protein [Candidatus Limnocylindria bacterium]